MGESVPDLAQSGDLIDAAVCVLASDDFIAGRQRHLGYLSFQLWHVPQICPQDGGSSSGTAQDRAEQNTL